MVVNPEPDSLLPAGGRLTLIGDRDAEQRYFRKYAERT
jgi:hypothetical protein